MEYEQSAIYIKNEYSFFYLNQEIIYSVLDELNIEYYIAPYHEYAQIRRLFVNEFFNAIAANLDFLPFGQNMSNFTNMIIDFDFNNQKFYWIDIKKVLVKLNISSEQINEFFLLGGILNTNCLLRAKTAENLNIFQAILAEERKKENLTNIIDQQYLSTYHNQRKKIENMPFLSIGCDLEIYIQRDFPERMKDLFGSYLPFQAYFFFCFNLLSKELVFALSRNKIYTKVPIADSLELRNLMENEFNTIVKMILGILTGNLSNVYKKQSYSLYKYYDIKEKPVVITGTNFVLPSFVPNLNVINKIKEKYKIDGFTFVHAIKVFLHLVLSEKKGSPNSNASPDFSQNKNKNESINLEKKNINEKVNTDNLIENPTNFEEISCYSKLVFMHVFEFLNIESKEISVLGSGLRKSGKFEEYIIILLQLMKSSVNHLYGKPICDAIKIRKISFESSPGLKNSLIDKTILSEEKIKEEFNLNTFLNVLENLKDEEKESLITCISRIFAFISPSIQYPKLKNVYDYDSSQYLSILQYTQNLLSETYQAIIFNIFISGEKKEKNFMKLYFDDAKKNLSQTFKNVFHVDISIALKLVLQMKDAHEFESFCNNDGNIMNALKHDFDQGLKLWNEVINLLKYQEKKGVFNSELNKLFMLADELLKTKFKELKIS